SCPGEGAKKGSPRVAKCRVAAISFERTRQVARLRAPRTGGWMRRLTLLLLIASLVTVGACKKKGKVDNNHDTDSEQTDTNTECVHVDLNEENEELQELIGSELMQATAGCGDLKKMEPAAMMGKLSDGEIRCLDKTLHEADRQTVKDKVSRVLMADAWA